MCVVVNVLFSAFHDARIPADLVADAARTSLRSVAGLIASSSFGLVFVKLSTFID